MLRIRGRVQQGRLIVDEPTDLPEGSEIDLVVADESAVEAWPAELDAELASRYREAKAGDVVPAEEFLAKLRARRTA